MTDEAPEPSPTRPQIPKVFTIGIWVLVAAIGVLLFFVVRIDQKPDQLQEEVNTAHANVEFMQDSLSKVRFSRDSILKSFSPVRAYIDSQQAYITRLERKLGQDALNSPEIEKKYVAPVKAIFNLPGGDAQLKVLNQHLPDSLKK